MCHAEKNETMSIENGHTIIIHMKYKTKYSTLKRKLKLIHMKYKKYPRMDTR
jgi:hypothetical protein